MTENTRQKINTKIGNTLTRENVTLKDRKKRGNNFDHVMIRPQSK